MASVSYRCDGLYHHVFQPETVPETHYPAPPSVQIKVTIDVGLLIVHHDCLTDRVTRCTTHFSQETLRFDLHLLQNHDQACEVLGAMLTRLLIYPASFTLDDIVDDIILHGLRIGNRASKSNSGGMVLPLRAEIRGAVEKHVNDERVLLRRVMEESALASNHGMVPAEESSVEKMLKKVKVKGEDCVICLEEINGGSDASQMPCSHTFHGACIEQWLKQSHFCPICRFEMPSLQS